MPVSFMQPRIQMKDGVSFMTHEEFQEVAVCWETKADQGTQMGEEELMAEISRYLEENNTCALAALEKNRNVCAAVFDKYQGFGKLKGMQITGTAEIVFLNSSFKEKGYDSRQTWKAVIRQ
jgi:hypothetical protein